MRCNNIASTSTKVLIQVISMQYRNIIIVMSMKLVIAEFLLKIYLRVR